MSLTINPTVVSTFVYPAASSTSLDTITPVTKPVAEDNDQSAARLAYATEKAERVAKFNEDEDKILERFNEREAKLLTRFNKKEASLLERFNDRQERSQTRFDKSEARYLSKFNRSEEKLLDTFDRNEERILNQLKRSYGLSSSYDITDDDRFTTYLSEYQTRLETFTAEKTVRQSDYADQAAERLADFETEAAEETADYEEESDARLLAFNKEVAERLADYTTSAAKRAASFEDRETEKLARFESTIDRRLDRYNDRGDKRYDSYTESQEKRVDIFEAGEDRDLSRFIAIESKSLTTFNASEENTREYYDNKETSVLAKIDATDDKNLKDLQMTPTTRLAQFNADEVKRMLLSDEDESYELVQAKWALGLSGSYDITGDSRFTDYMANIKQVSLTIDTPTAIEEGDKVSLDIGAVTIETAALAEGADATTIASAIKTAIDTKIDDENDHDLDTLFKDKNSVALVDNVLTLTGKDKDADISITNYALTQNTAHDLSGDATAASGNVQEAQLTIATPIAIEDGDTISVSIGSATVQTAALAAGTDAAGIASALKTAIDAKINDSGDQDLDNLIASTNDVSATSNTLTIVAKDTTADVTFSNYTFNEYSATSGGASTATPTTGNRQQSVLTVNAPTAIENGDTVQAQIGSVTVTTAALSTGDTESQIATALKTAVDAKINDPYDHDFDATIASADDVSVSNGVLKITAKDTSADVTFSNYVFNQNAANNLVSTATRTTATIQQATLSIAAPSNIEKGDTAQVKVGNVTVTTGVLSASADNNAIATAFKTAIDAKINDATDTDFDALIASTSDVTVNSGQLILTAKDTTADVTFSNYKLNEYEANRATLASNTTTQASALTVNTPTTPLAAGDTVQVDIGGTTVTTAALAANATSADIATALKTAIDAKINSISDTDFDTTINTAYHTGNTGVTVDGSVLNIRSQTTSAAVAFTNYTINGTGVGTGTPATGNIQKVTATIDTPYAIEATDTAHIDIGGVTVTTAALAAGATSSDIATALKTAIDAKISSPTDTDFDALIEDTNDVTVAGNVLAITGKTTSANVTLANYDVTEYNPGASTATIASNTDTEAAELTIAAPTTPLAWQDTVSVDIGGITVTTDKLPGGTNQSEIAYALKTAIDKKINDYADTDFDSLIASSLDAWTTGNTGVTVDDNVLAIKAKGTGASIAFTNYTITGTGVGTATPTTGTIQEVSLGFATPSAIEDYDTASVQIGGVTVTTADLQKGATAADIADAFKTAIDKKIADSTDSDFDTLIGDTRDVVSSNGALVIRAKNTSANITLSNYTYSEYTTSDTASSSATPLSNTIQVDTYTLTEPTGVEAGDTFKIDVGGVANVTTAAMSGGEDANAIATALKAAIDAKITDPADTDFDALIASTSDVTVANNTLTIRGKDPSATITLANYGFNEAAVNNTGASTATPTTQNIQESVLTVAAPTAVEAFDTVSVQIGLVPITTDALKVGDGASEIATALKTVIDQKINDPLDLDFDNLIASTSDVTAANGVLTIKAKDASADVTFSNYTFNENTSATGGASGAAVTTGNIQEAALTVNAPNALGDGDSIYVNVGSVKITTAALSSTDTANSIATALKTAIDAKINDVTDTDLDNLIASTADVTASNGVLTIRAKDTSADVTFSGYGINEAYANDGGDSTAQVSEQLITKARAEFSVGYTERLNTFLSATHTNRTDHIDAVASDRLDFELAAAQRRTAFIDELIDDRSDFIAENNEDRLDFIQEEADYAQSFQKKTTELYQKVADLV